MAQYIISVATSTTEGAAIPPRYANATVGRCHVQCTVTNNNIEKYDEFQHGHTAQPCESAAHQLPTLPPLLRTTPLRVVSTHDHSGYAWHETSKPCLTTLILLQCMDSSAFSSSASHATPAARRCCSCAHRGRRRTLDKDIAKWVRDASGSPPARRASSKRIGHWSIAQAQGTSTAG